MNAETKIQARAIRCRNRMAARQAKVSQARRVGLAGFWSLYLGTGTIDDLRGFHGANLPRELRGLLPDPCWGDEWVNGQDATCQLARALVKNTLKLDNIHHPAARLFIDEVRTAIAAALREIGEATANPSQQARRRLAR